MTGVSLVWVGRRASAPYEALCAEYAGRVERHLPFRQVRVQPAEGREDPRRALAKEAEKIRRHLAPGDTVIALDERGRERTTEELARWLEERTRSRGVVFVIGSDLGLDPALREDATEAVSLSRLTLPHHLARLVLLEQLYRVCDLWAGGQYHRGVLG